MDVFELNMNFNGKQKKEDIQKDRRQKDKKPRNNTGRLKERCTERQNERKKKRQKDKRTEGELWETINVFLSLNLLVFNMKSNGKQKERTSQKEIKKKRQNDRKIEEQRNSFGGQLMCFFLKFKLTCIHYEL